MNKNKSASLSEAIQNGYVQQDMNKVRQMIKLSDSPLAAKIYCYILMKADDKDALIVSNNFFSELFKISKSSVRRAIQALENANIISVKRKKGIAIYIINPNPQKEQMIEMNCNVIFTKEEWSSTDDR